MGLLEKGAGSEQMQAVISCLHCVRGHGSFENVFGYELKFVVLFDGK